LLDQLAAMQRRAGTALLLITHDPALAARCPRQLRIEDGLIVSDQMEAA
jgi:putative ABC transport system ATP-binding protein